MAGRDRARVRGTRGRPDGTRVIGVVGKMEVVGGAVRRGGAAIGGDRDGEGVFQGVLGLL